MFGIVLGLEELEHSVQLRNDCGRVSARRSLLTRFEGNEVQTNVPAMSRCSKFLFNALKIAEEEVMIQKIIVHEVSSLWLPFS